MRRVWYLASSHLENKPPSSSACFWGCLGLPWGGFGEPWKSSRAAFGRLTPASGAEEGEDEKREQKEEEEGEEEEEVGLLGAY